MSADSKKKRGEAGKSNAENIAFRYGGSKCDLSTKINRTVHPRMGGSRFLNAVKIGAMLGDVDSFPDRMMRAADENMERCPVVTEDKKRKFNDSIGWVDPSTAKNDDGITVRFGTKCEVSVGQNEPVDLSSAFEFKTVGNVHGLIRPTKDNDRASSLIIATLQKRGMFTAA